MPVTPSGDARPCSRVGQADIRLWRLTVLQFTTNPLRSLAVLTVATLVSGGCAGSGASSDSTAPRENQGIVAGTLSATASGKTLTLRNGTEFIVGYMVVTKDVAVIAMFPPCSSNCSTLAQGATVGVPFDKISGYNDKTTEAIVMWWKYQRNADGTLTAIEAVNSTRVAL